ncbi:MULTISPECIES: YqhG family protein [unclassified Virgibacillus]|uniref:YqhG family protein n=1 Tax=unclassified Virgibacillus TaxID=2620237 RepID=UPI0024DE2735|nr:YqhG family protein [Virgibacillus sp. LDC-1]
MAIANLHLFLHSFFTAHQCPVIHNEGGVLTVQLTEELDKALMNRPFYWHYVKSTGQKGKPMELTLITNPEKREEKGEWIHFGSPRLQQIIRYLKTTEKYTMLFQRIKTRQNTELHPWLVTNIKVSYIGKQKRDELFSIGLNLVNGSMLTEFMKQLEPLSFQSSISNFCYTIAPLIRLKSGYLRIESVLKQYIENQEQEWANASHQALDDELQMLKHFYTDKPEEESNQMKQEEEEIRKRFTPKVRIEVINGGLIYIKKQQLQQKTNSG